MNDRTERSLPSQNQRPIAWGPLSKGLFLLLLTGLSVGMSSRLVAAWLPLHVAPPEPQMDGQWHLHWQVPGEGWQFTIEYQRDLASEGWQPVPGTDWPVSAKEWSGALPHHETEIGSGSGQSVFFRVRAEPPQGDRGALISVQRIAIYGIPLLNLVFQELGAPIEPKFAVEILQVHYETIDPFGLPTQASGLLALPVGPAEELALMSYQHGTVLLRTDVPSEVNEEGLIPIAYASEGYVGIAPDYLGLGASPGFHPYLHARSQATAVVDFLRATRRYCAEEGIGLSGQIFLQGYSQGGHATLAAQREIEQHHADEFELTASAPMAGPYSMSEISFDDMLSDRVQPNPYYAAYILRAYFDLYPIARSFSEILIPPLDETVPPLFDGQTGSGPINALLPGRVREALQPDFLAALQTDTRHPLRLALRENDLVDWVPKVPTRLYHCSGDLDVLPANSDLAFERFQQAGAPDVSRLDPMPGADHGGCILPAFMAAKEWFDSLRSPVPF